jgi:multimeric flavodoxin WrbA
MKKVLGIVTSERKLGNTELLTKEIMANVPEPCEKELIRLTEFDIKPCRACYRCLQPDQRCAVKDDFNLVLDKIFKADAIILGVPIYFLGPHAYYKLFTDRLLGSGNYIKHTKNKPCVLVVPYGLHGWEGYARSALLVVPRLLSMKIVDYWQVKATLPAESLFSPQNMEYARNLGNNLFTLSEYSKGPRECSICGNDLFRLLPDGEIECPICAAKGFLGADNTVNYSDDQSSRFDERNMKEHFSVWLNEMKARFKSEKDKLKKIQEPYKELNWWIKK